MKRICRRFAFVLAFVLSIASSRAGLLDRIEGAVTNYVATNSVTGTNRSSASAAVNGLSQDQLVGGLKQALSNGLQHAVSELGHQNGFLTNLDVKIPMPVRLVVVEKTLHSLKQDKLANDFVTSMNRAAEQAVPVATEVFVDALRNMSIDDAKAILTGPNDAATQYFKRTTSTNLFARFIRSCKRPRRRQE